MSNNLEYYDCELQKIDTRLLHAERWILIMIAMALMATLVVLIEVRNLETKKSQAGPQDFATMEKIK